jgi:asparagine synthetase B (glutamine-hydrolysing)
MSTAALVRLDPIETLVDEPIGQDKHAPPLPEIEPGLTALGALERVMRSALQRPPCLIAFSGGLDSSTLLAAATRVARREGLPLPIPATMRFPEVPETEESAWQEAVVRELDLDDWHRREMSGELDMVGPAAQAALRGHGLISPGFSYFWVPLLDDASPGTLVTGHDGDGLFGGWRLTRFASLTRRQASFEWNDVRGVFRELAPIPVRRAWYATRTRCTARWVRPKAAAEIARRYARAAAEEPMPWNRRVAWFARSRAHAALRQAFEALGDGAGTRAIHAYLDPVLLAAVARVGGRTGFGDRNSTIRALFGKALPEAVASRRDKVEFSGVYWGPRTREFASRWSGDGVPEDLIDAAALRQEWLEPIPDARSALLLHAVWLEEQRETAPQPFNCQLPWPASNGSVPSDR